MYTYRHLVYHLLFGYEWEDIENKPEKFPPEDHTHPIPEVEGLEEALDGKSDKGHHHPIPEVDGLQDALDGKSDVGHTHDWDEVTDKPTEFPPEHHTHLKADITDLTDATQDESGLMSPADKEKLDGLIQPIIPPLMYVTPEIDADPKFVLSFGGDDYQHGDMSMIETEPAVHLEVQYREVESPAENTGEYRTLVKTQEGVNRQHVYASDNTGTWHAFPEGGLDKKFWSYNCIVDMQSIDGIKPDKLYQVRHKWTDGDGKDVAPWRDMMYPNVTDTDDDMGLRIGDITVNVTQGEEGAEPSGEASASGGAGGKQDLEFNFVIPPGEKGERGEKGEKGDSLTYEQLTPEQQEALKGEKGDPGEDGAPGKDGTTFTPSVDEEGNLSWSNDGGKENPQSTKIKGEKGDKGDPGPANTLTIGTVTTGEPGTEASATITGDAPNQTLNLTIPRGKDGKDGESAGGGGGGSGETDPGGGGSGGTGSGSGSGSTGTVIAQLGVITTRPNGGWGAAVFKAIELAQDGTWQTVGEDIPVIIPKM